MLAGVPQLGCVGVPGMGLPTPAPAIVTSADEGEIQPPALVTVYEYVAAIRPFTL